MESIFTKKVENKVIVWFKANNRYAIFPDTTATILQAISDNVKLENIAQNLATDVNVPYEKAFDFVTDVYKKIYTPSVTPEKKVKKDVALPDNIKYEVVRYYQINNFIFKVDFQTEEEAFWIHPKFAHLEVEKQLNFNFNYQVFTKNEYTTLFVDEKFIGSWNKDNIHYFQGKFSMEIVQSIHHKREEEWMGVFHASAVSNGKESMLFLGDSGNGKSTSLALLQANGFTCIADDFVPVDVEKKEVYSFPSAISIKKNSVPVLRNLYPELETSAEYHLKLLNKVVRYLPPNNSNYTKHLPCKALIFIKYDANIELEFNTISNLEAFEKLVPDSWLSPEPENAKIFLNWFANLPCYQIVYSSNTKMIKTVTNIFNNEL